MSTAPRSNGKLARGALTNPKLEEAFQAHGQSGHRFEKKTFTRPTYCHHCTDLLWGLTNQGLICEVCNYVTHERCMADVVVPCISIATTLVKYPVAHSWSGPSYFKRKFCSVCRKRVEDYMSFRCQACEYYVHEDCKEFSVSDCKQCATYVPHTDNKRLVQHIHHWREGVPTSSRCAYCKRACGTAENLSSMRCSWCATTAHSGCFHHLPKLCNFGYLHRLVLPPYAVSIPNIHLWSSCSRSRIGSASLKRGSRHSLGDAGLGMEESLITDEESSYDERRDSSNTCLRIYDGEVTSPRMYKKIKVPRTAQVHQVLEEALKKFHITDDPNNYYLTRIVDQKSDSMSPPPFRKISLVLSSLTQQQSTRKMSADTERQLEPEELPMQFCENGSKPLIFLRMKTADRRKGYIKVYPGLINATASKAVPVTASTSSIEVISSLLTKFGLKNDGNADDYCLTVTHLHRGVQERRMEDHECPWKTLMDERKKSVRRMKTTRFYLRRNLEPSGSVTLCVGGLPTSSVPDKVRYEAILQDILGETMQFCDIESIYSSYGMAFLKLPAADVASDAFEKIRSSVLDGKPLFVKLLPNIYPGKFHAECEPLLVFINSRSGGGQGEDMLATFQRSLNLHQVCSLSEGGPLPWLYTFKDVPRFRILVCGGDGTVGWVLSCLDDVCHELNCHSPPSAIVPLGTGNDLARVLRWGSGHSGHDDPMSLLMAVDQAERVSLDRWTVLFDNADPTQADARSDDSAIGSTCDDEPNMFVMNNYFSIGIDAELCLEFHMKREEKPERFTSRLHNKGVYVRSSIRKMMKKSSKIIQDDIDIEVDGKKVDLPVLEGIVLLNIGSWAAGANLWGSHSDDNFAIPSHSDGMVEVIGLNGVMHMGQIQSGIRGGIHLAQGSQINIKLKSDWPVQIDGEPWMQSAGQVIVRPALMQARMLKKRKARVKTAPAYPRMARQATIGTSNPTSIEVSRSVFHTPLSP